MVLLRLAEMWCALPVQQPLSGSGRTDPKLSVRCGGAVYAVSVRLHPLNDPVGMAIYVELHYMMDAILTG